MKVDIDYIGNVMKCDLCEKEKPCAVLQRPAKRHERENFYLCVCRECNSKITEAFETPITTTQTT